jgi:chaperonin cofactor prefoldin
MASSKVEELQCFCAWLNTVGAPFVGILTALLDSTIALLTTAKMLLALVPLNLTDQLKKLEMQAELAVIEVATQPVEAPIALVTNSAKAFNDCPPTAELARRVGQIREVLLGSVDDYKYQLQNLIDAIDREALKIEELDQWINNLQEFKEAIKVCAE